MKKSTKRKWLKALRSGEYDQCTGIMCRSTADGDSFCCLGVLRNETTGFVKGDLVGFLNEEELKLHGLYSSQQYMLAAMNDNRKSFEEIADYIEQNL